MIDISKPEPLSLTHKIHFTWGKPSVSLDEMKLVLSALKISWYYAKLSAYMKRNSSCTQARQVPAF
jgi:hypothetical protein